MEQTRINQKTRILALLETVEWLSQLDCTRIQKPILRLSERIRELQKDGHEITGEWRTSQYGRFYAYRLERK